MNKLYIFKPFWFIEQILIFLLICFRHYGMCWEYSGVVELAETAVCSFSIKVNSKK